MTPGLRGLRRRSAAASRTGRRVAAVLALLAGPVVAGCTDPLDGVRRAAGQLVIWDGTGPVDTLRLAVSDTVRLVARNPLGEQLGVVWTSTNTDVASVTEDGLVTGRAAGMARIGAVYSLVVTTSVPVVVE